LTPPFVASYPFAREARPLPSTSDPWRTFPTFTLGVPTPYSFYPVFRLSFLPVKLVTPLKSISDMFFFKVRRLPPLNIITQTPPPPALFPPPLSPPPCRRLIVVTGSFPGAAEGPTMVSPLFPFLLFVTTLVPGMVRWRCWENINQLEGRRKRIQRSPPTPTTRSHGQKHNPDLYHFNRKNRLAPVQ